jgi:hypothetical protein
MKQQNRKVILDDEAFSYSLLKIIWHICILGVLNTGVEREREPFEPRTSLNMSLLVWPVSSSEARRHNHTMGTQENEHFQKFHENAMFYTTAELVIGSRGISMTFQKFQKCHGIYY